jgi:hypothetical protein
MTDTATGGALEALLDDFLDGALTDWDGPPEGIDQADKLLWALRGVRRRQAEVAAVAKARTDQVNAWRDDQLASLGRDEARLSALLEGWAHAQHEDTGRKTWKLPAGELKVRPRMVTADWMGDDPAALAKVVPEAVVTEQRVMPGEVKKIAQRGYRWPERDPCAPPGRLAYHALVAGKEAPGIVLYAPAPGRDGRQFSAVTK